MAQFADYRVSLLDWNGNKIRPLFPGDDFLSIRWQHARNRPGPYYLDLVGETGTKDRFLKNYQVLIERNYAHTTTGWYEEYVGFHLGRHERWLQEDSEEGVPVDTHYWASVGLSPEWLVSQPQLQPVRNVGNPNWAYYDIWWNHGYADDVAKSMVAESMVAPPDVDRAFSHLALQGDLDAGVWGCYEGNWVRLDDAIREAIGEDGTRGGCDFRVERVSGGYEFRTYAPFYGTDRRRGNAYGNKPCVFSLELGNLKDPELLETWAEAVTAAYGGWQGAGMERSIYLEENAAALAESPYSRREAYYDVKDITSPDSIAGFLQQKLVDDGVKLTLTAGIIQTGACLYGRDFRWGDLATVDLPGGESFPVRIAEISGSLDGQNEETIEGAIELWTRD